MRSELIFYCLIIYCIKIKSFSSGIITIILNRVGDSGLQQYAMEHVLENEINKFILTLLLKKKRFVIASYENEF